MALTKDTKEAIGRTDLPERDDLSSALGVHTSIIKRAEFSKAEQELLGTNQLTVEDNDPFFTLYEITQRNALIKPTYDPWRLAVLNHQNNTLLQCVSAMEINIDGVGYAIDPKDPKDPEETVQGEIDGEKKKLPLEVEGEEGKPPVEEKKPPIGEKKPPVEGEKEGEIKPGARPFKAPPTNPKEVVEQEEEKFAEREDKRLEEEEKVEKVQAIKDEEDEQRKGVEEFFDEPWPGMSFTTIRRKLRRDIEGLGNGYLEVIRNVKGEIVFLNYLDAKLVRLVRLGKPTQVEEEITRFGKTSTVQTLKRERRYAMLIGAMTTVSNVTKVIYFKEFKASRDLNKWNGLWDGKDEDTAPLNEVIQRPETPAVEGTKPATPQVPALTGLLSNDSKDFEEGPIEAKNQASEIIHFTAIPDIGTLYGVPRWINQTPSILGSRKAEEQNLEFFNSGGIPPVMILIQGGSLSEQSRDALTSYMAGESKHKQRGVIAELFSTTGDLTSAGNVRVSVERFGAERQQDAMFMKYDELCANHVRKAFRLPPLFLGDSKEHNFATAKASYMVAEAQVFEPERDEFDEVINNHIMKELAPEWLYRSKSLSINDVEMQLKALESAKDVIDKECFIEQIAEVAHLELECREEDDEEPDVGMEVAKRMGMLEGQPAAVQQGQPGAVPPFQQIDVQGDQFGKIAKINDDVITELADDWSAWLSGVQDFSEDSVDTMRLLIKSLAPSVRRVFNGYVAMKMLSGEHYDSEGTADLFSQAGEVLSDRGKSLYD